MRLLKKSYSVELHYTFPAICVTSYLVSSCFYILIFGGFQKFKDNCNPVYEETLEYEGQLREMTRTLEVQVVSKKTFAPNPILGMVRLTVSRLSE